MFKNTKNFTKLFTVPRGILYIIVGCLFIGISLSIVTRPETPSFIFPFGLFAGGYALNVGIGGTFFGDEYKLRHSSRNRDVTLEPVETLKFLKRRKIVSFIGSILYALLVIYYLVKLIILCLGSHNTFDLVGLIISIIVSLIIGICMFRLYLRTKHVSLKRK